MQKKDHMHFRVLLLALLITTAFYACGKKEVIANPDLKEILPGTWETVSIKVTINATDHPDSTYVFLDISEKDWKKKLGVRPTKTFFETDNLTYRTESYDLQDVLLNTTRGKWFTNGDTLRLISSEATYEYEVTASNGLNTFHCFLDWDEDGAEDDEYIEVQRKISNYSK